MSMSKKFNNWLQIKVFAGLGLLLFSTAVSVTYLNLLAQDSHKNQELLSHVRQLDVQGQAIKRRAITYASNAPRDFAPYERDLLIFYPDFTKDLQAFDKQVLRLVKMERELPRSALHSKNDILKTSISNLKSNWVGFKQGFQEKIGPNINEPRLEWGADYVKDNQELINSITGNLIVTIDNAIQNQLNTNKGLSQLAMGGACVLLILGMIWFYFRVVRRITLAVKGCQRVAQGDFGYQLTIKGNDELSALAMAFNTLSARTRFVLTMLTKMHRHGSAESKVDALWKEAGNYLPIQWLGLWKVNRENDCLEFMSIRSDRSMHSSLQKSLIKAASDDQHLLEISKQSLPVKYDNLPRAVTSIPSAKLMRELLKLGLLNSQLIVPLTSDDGWEGILVFVATKTSAYSDEQIELIGNLSPYIANGFSQIKKPKQKPQVLKTA